MTCRGDAELLNDYAASASEAAFRELVRRHIDAVHAVALRQVGGDAHLANDVTQTVFTTLARKAAALSDRAVLGGWLHRTTQFAARDVVRSERRRRAREQEALMIEEHSPGISAEVDWDRLRFVLDELMSDLKEPDRDAVWLRFYQGRSFADIGAALQLTENAARMRVDRALERLHAALARRGVKSTTAALAGGTGVQAFLSLVAMNKIKIGIVSVIVAAFVATGVVEVRANRALRTELGTIATARDDIAQLQQESRQLNSALQKLAANNPEVDELSRLRRRAAVLRARPPGVVDAAMKPASAWANVGRATPETANETFHWTMFHGDLDAIGSFVVFDDDNPGRREAFMAHFSDAVRARYRTPERLCAAAFFAGGGVNDYSPDDAFQMIAVDDHVGGNGSRFGQKRVRVWYRLASGREFEGGSRWQSTPNGWAPGAFSLGKDWQSALSALDPATGNRRPQLPTEHLPMKPDLPPNK